MSWMPTLAIFTYELRGLAGQLVGACLVPGDRALIFIAVAGSWRQVESAPLIASLLFSYLVFPWFLVVIMLGISPITGFEIRGVGGRDSQPARDPL